MAIALDTTVVNAANGLTWSHTCTGTNLILFVSVLSSTNVVRTVTYNGVSMTSLGSSVDGNSVKLEMFYLIAPTTGTNTVSVSGANNIRCVSASYTGALQSGQPDSHNQASATGNITVNTTVVASNCWLVVAASDADGTPTITTNLTNRNTSQVVNVNYCITFADSNGTVGTGSQGATGTASSGGATTNMIVASVSPAPNVALFTRNFIIQQAVNRSNNY